MELARFLLSFMAVVFFASCGQQASELNTTKVKIDFGSLALSSGAGGVVIIDQYSGGNMTYVLSAANSSEVFNVVPGAHTFHAFAWGGPNPLEGTVYCGSQSVVLVDSSVTALQSVSVTASPAGCANYSNGVDTTYGIDSLDVVGCSSINGITSFGDSCSFPPTKWGHSSSFKLTISGTNGRNLISSCFADNGSGGDSSLGDRVINTNIRIPTGGVLGLVPSMQLVGYDRLDCTTGSESAKTLSISASFEGVNGATNLVNSGTKNKLFWGQNNFGVQTQILSSYIPSFYCSTPSAGTAAPCYQDYNLAIDRNSDNSDLYYQRAGTSTTFTFYSNETTSPWYHLTKGTPNAVGAPAYCTVSASTGYGNTPTCTCGASAGDSGGGVQGCNLAIFHDNAIDLFTGHPSATPKSVTLTMINASPAPTSATYALDVYVSDTNFEGIAYAVESEMNLFGSNYGKYTYYQAGTDASYQQSNNGYIYDLVNNLGEGGISGALSLLGYSACSDSVVTGSFSSEFEGSTATVTLNPLTATETSLLFPMSTPVAFDRKYRLTFTTAGESQEITWLFKCAGATSPTNEQQVGEIWSNYNYGNGDMGVEHLVYDHSTSAKYSQYSKASSWGNYKYYNFSQVKNFGTSGHEVKTINVNYSSGTPSGYKVASQKQDLSDCTYVAYADNYQPTPSIIDSTNISFSAGIATPTASIVQANASTYASCTATPPSSMIAPSLLWAAATPAATAYIHPYFVANKQFNSTCSGAGTVRTGLECAIYNRLGVTPTLVSLEDVDQFSTIETMISGGKNINARARLNRLKQQWALEMGSCVELAPGGSCL